MTASIGTKLRYIRQEKRLDQNYVAHASGLSQSQISRIENNQKQPSDAEVQKLARIYEMEKDDIKNYDVPQGVYQNNHFEKDGSGYVYNAHNQEIVVSELKDVCGLLKNELAESRAEIQRLRSEIQEKDKRIAALQGI